MVAELLKFVPPFLEKKRKHHIPVILLKADKFKSWISKQDSSVKHLCEQTGFKAQPERVIITRDKKGEIEAVIAGMGETNALYNVGTVVTTIRQALSKDFLGTCSFYFDGEPLKSEQLENAHIGWALACYKFSTRKNDSADQPALLWSPRTNKKRVLAFSESIVLLRNIINAPANAMGPEELEATARHVAKRGKAQIIVIQDNNKLLRDFPLVHAVGDGSDRRPRLIDIKWGDTKNPKITLVGKGVCFDTGGLNIKPTSAMALMKKDMGGAAHVLALATLVMALKLPVRLRVLIPAVENAISGRAFRPGDIFKSRKGLTVENTNTDAEGRLILADALTYACEEKTDLIIDFATLTGSARAGLGPDIPPVFSNNEKILEDLKKASSAVADPLWPMPLWQPYKKLIESPVADLVNSVGIPGDLIFSALFLEQFLTGSPDWVHLDIYAWEHTGKPGRPKGGADTGLRAVLRYLEDSYAHKKSRKT